MQREQPKNTTSTAEALEDLVIQTQLDYAGGELATSSSEGPTAQSADISSGVPHQMGHMTLLSYTACSVSVCSNANLRQILDARVSMSLLFPSFLILYLSWA
ncbi:hypothetical protein [Ferrimicrobium sp.]|uniref:hypothetical protein n=1 Tax=Ferrimicrobium sp. TaxID=2926050 RepID=UPI002611E538|nr:hypothetical protein [Ferrimicrobium sp.]